MQAIHVARSVSDMLADSPKSYLAPSSLPFCWWRYLLFPSYARLNIAEWLISSTSMLREFSRKVRVV